MASEKYLAVVGVGEEDTAHLRLLLRAASSQLEHRWRWSAEENADLLIIDPAELAGQIGRNRAFNGGRRCAVFSENEPLRDGEVRLTKPLKGDGLIAVLNGTGATAVQAGAPVTQFKNDFYDVDSFNPEFQLEEDEAADARSRQREANPAPGLDELLKPDTESAKPQFAVPINLDDETAIQRAPGSTARSERRVADSLQGLRAEKPEGINLGSRLAGVTVAGDVNAHPLRDYLKQNLLGGPATVSVEGAPPLTLDPKERKYHAAGSLRALAPYCKYDFSKSGWKPVTSQELARLRSEQPAQPYGRLVWFDALVRSGGRLAQHLDPGGRFRLKMQPRTEADFPKHAQIAAVMHQSAKLNEIAAASSASMAEVFDMVNAYDAVGLIEVEKRLPRHAAPAPPSGLLARLRKPFGKS